MNTNGDYRKFLECRAKRLYLESRDHEANQPVWLPEWLFPDLRNVVGCVYIAKNLDDGKCYVGKTHGRFLTRKAWHLATARRGDGFYFHNAIASHGRSRFVWSIVYRSNDDEKLSEAEMALIAFYDTRRPNGYNLTMGGDGVIGRDAECIERIASFHRGRKRSADTKRRISEACMGMKRRLGARLSDETKAKISVSRKGKMHSKESKEKIGSAHKGVPKSPEQRAKMSAARKAWWERKRAERESETPLLDGIEILETANT